VIISAYAGSFEKRGDERPASRPKRRPPKENTVSTDTLTDTDIYIRDAVTRQLDWDPQVDASALGVAAKGGIVTLTGYIDSYSGKLDAERAAKRVHGVRAVANEIEVRLKIGRTDTDIARDALRALELHSMVPKAVQAVVRDGQVTLTGTVTWLFQKQTAEHAVRHVRGVKQVMNNLIVAPRAAAHDVRRRIMTALHQDADVDARHISVTLSGNTATLTGSVATWLQRESAERAAANAPGIVNVDNRIVVEPVQPSMFDGVDDMC
jgi:osmotically-inducible protein OsmY